jgi:hypothetical protein
MQSIAGVFHTRAAAEQAIRSLLSAGALSAQSYS